MGIALRRYITTTLALVIAAGGAGAQQARDSVSPGVGEPGSGQPRMGAADTASLIILNRTIATFRAPLGAQSARERAIAAASRIEAIADEAADAGGVARVWSRIVPEGVLVVVGERGVFTLLHSDVDTLRGERLDSLTTAAITRLSEVLTVAAEERSLIHLLQSLGLAALATLLF
nr:hypothetical protein [Gemmatimonadaceae bacterium]